MVDSDASEGERATISISMMRSPETNQSFGNSGFSPPRRARQSSKVPMASTSPFLFRNERELEVSVNSTIDRSVGTSMRRSRLAGFSQIANMPRAATHSVATLNLKTQKS